MEKEEILSAAVQSKNKGEEYESKVISRGSIYGSSVAVILGFVLLIFEYLICGKLNMGLIAVGLVASAVQFLYEGIKTKKAHIIAIGVFQSVVTLLALLGFAMVVLL